MKPVYLTVPLLALWAPCLAGDEATIKTAPTACHGTTVEFVDTPVEAAKLAARQKKLVLVLHVSGHFEDPGFT